MKTKQAIILSLAVLALAGCGQETGNGPGAAVSDAKGLRPHETVEQSAQALKHNDLGALLRISLPDDKYAEVKAQWEAKKREPISEEDRAEYARMMETLTQDDAVNKLMVQIEPQLEQMRAQMPMFIGMFQGIAQSAITQSEEMTEEQRQQAQKAITAVAAWAQRTDLASAERARDAVTIAVDTANEVDLPTLDGVRALSYEEMLKKAGIALAGIKDMLSVYDLHVDRTLDSVRAETVTERGDAATVRTSLDFLGTQQVYEGEYVKLDDRWFAREAVDASIEKIAAE